MHSVQAGCMNMVCKHCTHNDAMPIDQCEANTVCLHLILKPLNICRGTACQGQASTSLAGMQCNLATSTVRALSTRQQLSITSYKQLFKHMLAHSCAIYGSADAMHGNVCPVWTSQTSLGFKQPSVMQHWRLVSALLQASKVADNVYNLSHGTSS
jgi:hypothetical protein